MEGRVIVTPWPLQEAATAGLLRGFLRFLVQSSPILGGT